MRILVYGAGPLGSVMAVRLHEAGHDVSVIARGERLAQLKEHGVVIREEGSDVEETAWVSIVERFEPEDDYDLVMVVMRRNQALQILDTLSQNTKVSTFLFMVNSAAGPQAYIDAVGRERVMLGFPYPGGEREGYVMRVVPVNEEKVWTIPMGEPDGRVTDRTRAVAATLGSMRGYKVEIRTDMDAWLKNHVALLMSAMAPAIYATGIDVKRFARTRDLLVLSVRGIREALRGLNRAGVSTSPRALKVMFVIPEPLLVRMFSRRMKDESLRSSLEGHPRAARDELQFLAEELAELFRAHGIETPIFDRMARHYDPGAPLVPDGSREIPMQWGGTIAAAAGFAAVIAVVLVIVR